MMPHEKHRAESPKRIRVAVLTASSSRYFKKIRGEDYVDESGELAVALLQKHGYEVMYLGVVNDDVWMIRDSVVKAIADGNDVVVITGGTGISPRDVTVEAVRPLLDKEMEGFGEIFRVESYRQIGPSAAMSRAVAGTANGRLILALPGSPKAVELALELFASEIPHMLHIARGGHSCG
jgi:molybdenum cofactor biosynthesis protein B